MVTIFNTWTIPAYCLACNLLLSNSPFEFKLISCFLCAYRLSYHLIDVSKGKYKNYAARVLNQVLVLRVCRLFYVKNCLTTLLLMDWIYEFCQYVCKTRRKSLVALKIHPWCRAFYKNMVEHWTLMVPDWMNLTFLLSQMEVRGFTNNCSNR